MLVEQVAVEKLIPYANNARTHSDAQVAQIAASIREFGFNNPVLIDEQSSIIAGHGRVLAARKLELDAVPCIRLNHLSDTQRRAYIIADNKLAMNAGWDDELLALELSDLQDQGVNVELSGFTVDEIEGFTPGENYPESSAKEIDPDDYKMGHQCPKCGFEFDAKT
jgi:ParB-like chromosome segregation protein Spo0J